MKGHAHFHGEITGKVAEICLKHSKIFSDQNHWILGKRELNFDQMKGHTLAFLRRDDKYFTFAQAYLLLRNFLWWVMWPMGLLLLQKMLLYLFAAKSIFNRIMILYDCIQGNICISFNFTPLINPHCQMATLRVDDFINFTVYTAKARAIYRIHLNVKDFIPLHKGHNWMIVKKNLLIF